MNDPTYEGRARARKAYRLHRVLLNVMDTLPDDTDPNDLMLMTESQRARVATIAGTRAPSPETWSMAVDFAREALAYEHADRRVDDPPAVGRARPR